MTQYIKDGIIYNNLSSISLDGMRIINPKKEQILAAGYEIYVAPVVEETDEEKLAKAIDSKIVALGLYADSDEMNSYIAMGVTIRLNLDLRTRLRHVINSKIALGETTLTEYYEGVNYTYPLTAWDRQLTLYENYLYEVVNVAEQHKLNIEALTTIEDVDAYDYTTGYPESLNFDVDNRTDEEKLADAITDKITEIDEYDQSENVNICYYGETPFWIDKQTRLSLMNSTTIEKNAGRTTTKLILEDLSYELPVDTVLSMLATLELYAKDCYDVTAQHKLNVKALTTIDDIDAYDYTTGYPEKIIFEIQNIE